jgi:predicted exporter
LKRYGISLLKSGSKFIGYGNIDKKSLPLLSNLEFAKPLSIKMLFEKRMQQSVDRLIVLGLFAILFIVVMLLLVAGKGLIRALTYLLFPLAVILLYAYFVPLNILHIFMIFIVLSISIDYGIYTARSVDAETKQAIAFSLLSTFAGFGVLVFSQINALFSIGIIATLGILALFLLLIFLKGPSDVSHTAQR